MRLKNGLESTAPAVTASVAIRAGQLTITVRRYVACSAVSSTWKRWPSHIAIFAAAGPARRAGIIGTLAGLGLSRLPTCLRMTVKGRIGSEHAGC
jgi:hypothetical protein